MSGDGIKELRAHTVWLDLAYFQHAPGSPEDYILSCLASACEFLLLRLAKKGLSLSSLVHIDSELWYEYKGIRFAVEIVRGVCWDATFVVRCAFEEKL